MTLNIPIPEDLDEAIVRRLEHDALELVAVRLYQEGQLNYKELEQRMGMDRWQVEAVLKKHGVTEDLISREEFRLQADSVQRRGF